MTEQGYRVELRVTSVIGAASWSPGAYIPKTYHTEACTYITHRHKMQAHTHPCHTHMHRHVHVITHRPAEDVCIYHTKTWMHTPHTYNVHTHRHTDKHSYVAHEGIYMST